MVKTKLSPAQISSPALRRFENVIWRDPNSLIEYAMNSRNHPPAQVSKLAGHIVKFGFDVPIVIDENGVILKGHCRKLASLQLGLKEVPVIVRDDLTETEKKALRIADNQLSTLGEINLENINFELIELETLGVDLSSLGFNQLELDKLTAPVLPPEPNKDVETAQAEVDAKAGNRTFQYSIIFEDEDQQRSWFRFLKILDERCPNLDTVGQRLHEYIEQEGI